MNEIHQILVVGRTSTLQSELNAALSAVRGRRGSLRGSKSYREGIEDARLHAPDIVIAELDGDIGETRAFAEEIGAVVPGVVVAIAYERSVFEDDGSEGDALIRLTRAGVRDFLHRPVSAADLRQLLDRSATEAPLLQRGRLGTLTSFVSNKGGVGKSTLAVNTAVELGRRFPDRVLLVDCSLQHGVCSSMLDLKPERTIADATRELGRLDETLLRQHATVHSSGLHVLAAPSGIVAASEVDERAVARVLGLARRTYEYVVVDTFPTVDAIVVCVLDMSDRVHVVVQPIVPFVLGAVGLFQAMEGLGVPDDAIRVIVNRGVRPFTGELTPEVVAARLGNNVDVVVPYERRLSVALNSGAPMVLASGRRSGFVKSVRGIAQEIAEIRSTGRGGESNGKATEGLPLSERLAFRPAVTDDGGEAVE